jgi:hypothetical protein
MNRFRASPRSLCTVALAGHLYRELDHVCSPGQQLDSVSDWYPQDIVVVVADVRMGLFEMVVVEDCF